MTRRYLTLDGMRGVAALLVVVFHLSGMLKPQIFEGAYLAVDFFFVLSGFVIAEAYDGVLRSRVMSARDFITRRVIRLWPLFILGLLLGALYFVPRAFFNPVNGEPLPLMAGVALGAALIPTPWLSPTHQLYAVNIPAWSLFYELVANLLYCLIAPYLTTRRLIGLVLVAAVALAAVALWLEPTFIDPDVLNYTRALARVMFAFFAGVLLQRMPRPTERAADRAVLVLFAILGLFLALAPAANPWFDLISRLIAFPALVWLGTAIEPVRLMTGISRTLGAASYAIYILHVPLIRWLLLGLNRVHLPPIVDYLIIVPVIVAAALLADRLWDIPVRRWLSARFLRARPALASAAT